MHELAIESVQQRKRSFNVVNIQLNESIQSMKVIDHIERRAKMKNRFYSIEISYSDNSSLNFNEFMVQPLFMSIPWFKDNLKVENELEMPAIQLWNSITSTRTLLHLTCYEMDEIKLNRLLELKIDNILALRGDDVAPNQPLKHAIDLVKLIKQNSPQTTISVGGYPDVHPEAVSSQLDLKYLKEKVDAGADFIITQICFSATNILRFITQCRDIGIKICKVMVPEDDFQIYKQLKDDQVAFDEFAAETSLKIINGLFQNVVEPIVGVHFFSLNNFELIKQVVNTFGFE